MGDMKNILITIAAVVLVGCGGSSIHQATIDGKIALIRRELSNGANVNQKNEDGCTLLHLAVQSGHKRIVELLIAKGADVNAKNTRGATSLDYSTELNETFGALNEIWGDNKIEGITTTQTLEIRNEDGSVNQVTVNNAKNKEIADLLRKHGGKTSEELKAEGK
ncbi:MAG: ankyrin repeat domain-containing protein [Gammaproteobacteria bacterium]|nr:ankyrin repeat domain-containing protein [Gammaproteobacteria bacterium]